MSDLLKIRMLTDPPEAGECKLRIKSDGTWEGTRVFVVDSEGRELNLLGVTSLYWRVDPRDPAESSVRVQGSVETELDVLNLDVNAKGPKS